jgi:hypothetical protein
MEFVLFSDIDNNFSISLMEDEKQVKLIEVHPETGEKMDRPTALALAEQLCNVVLPKSKAEFISFMNEDDYEKFVIAKATVEEEIRNVGIANTSPDTRSFHAILLKMDMLQDFTFKEKELETLTKFCKVFDLSVIPNHEEE